MCVWRGVGGFDRAPLVSATLTGNTWHAVNTVLYRRSNELLNRPVCIYGLRISSVAGQNTTSAGALSKMQAEPVGQMKGRDGGSARGGRKGRRTTWRVQEFSRGSGPAGRAEGRGGDLLRRSRRDGSQQGLALVRPLVADDGVGAFRESRTEATEQQGQEKQLEFTTDSIPVISKL